MKLLVVAVSLCIANGVRSEGILGNIADSHPFSSLYGAGEGAHDDSCQHDPFEPYRKAQNEFYKRLYAAFASRGDNHFVFSPFSIWLSLAALSEGADPSVQGQEFDDLYLSDLQCMRDKFYDISKRVIDTGRGIDLESQQILIVDEKTQVNNTWAQYVMASILLNVDLAPIKSDPQETSSRLKEFLGAKANINFRGNSVLVNALDYKGDWTTAFPNASNYEGPFYNDVGQQIATVEMMKIKKRVRVAQIPFTSTKVVELPVGNKGEYSMLIAVGSGSSVVKNALHSFLGIVFDIFSMLTLSEVPIEISIPKFRLSSEFDATAVLHDIGIDWYWKDPAATRYVSDPPAMPSSLIEQVSIKFNNEGVDPQPSSPKSLPSSVANMAPTGMASAVGEDFIVDRPFMFALVDTKYHAILFAGAYAQPADGEF